MSNQSFAQRFTESSANIQNQNAATAFNSRRTRGVTLIEAAMVLAILAVIVAGIMVFYTNADSSRKTSAAMSELGAVQQGIRSLYAGQSTYAGLAAANLINTDTLPARMIDGNNIRHSLNGEIAIAPANAGGGGTSGFSVAYDNIPAEACAKMVTQDLGRGLFSVEVGGTTRSVVGNPPPFDPQAAANACTGAANAITWTFR